MLHQYFVCILAHGFVVKKFHHAHLILEITRLNFADRSDHLEALAVVERVVYLYRRRLKVGETSIVELHDCLC